MHLREQQVELVEEELGAVPVLGVEHLLADEALAQPLERLRVDVRVAVEHRVDERAVRAGELHLHLLRHQRAARGAERLLEEAVDVSIAAEDHERLGVHVDDAGRLDVGLVDGPESGARQGALGVVAVGVALDGFDRQPVEHVRNRVHGLDRTAANRIRLHSGSLGESDSHLLSPFSG
ncbi:hypothetical protein GS913_06400 [Rhodococcus hoagii]|nr:hypothetical protein [Prescottella equi]